MSHQRALRRARSFVCALILTAGFFGSARAFAGNVAGYVRHYQAAHRLVRAGDRRGAIREFVAAYAASPNPDVLFNIGVLYSKLAVAGGAIEDAHRSLDYFDQYLRRYAAAHGDAAPDRKTVERYTTELRRRFALADESPEPTPPTTPLAPPTTSPGPPAPTPTPPAQATPSREAAPAPVAPTMPLAKPAPHRLPLLMPALPSIDAPAAPSRTRTIAGYTLLATGLVAAGTSAVLFGLGYSSDGDKSGQLGDYTNSLLTLGHERTAALALSVSGTAALVSAALTLLLPPRRAPSHPAAKMAVRLLLVDGRF